MTIALMDRAIERILAARDMLLPHREAMEGGSGAESARTSRDRDYLLRVGTHAAGAVHELASPLCTMTLLVDELLDAEEGAESGRSKLGMMSEQVRECRRIVAEFMAYARGQLVEPEQGGPVDEILLEVLDKWRAQRPGVEIAHRWSGLQPVPLLADKSVMCTALVSLLNNAADASPQLVELEARWTARELTVLVMDYGAGLAKDVRDVIGERVVSTKGERGNGVGVVFAKAAIQAAGGSLRFSGRPHGGTQAEVVLPVGEQRP